MTKKSRTHTELRRVDRDLQALAKRIGRVRSPVARQELFRRADSWLDERLRVMRG